MAIGLSTELKFFHWTLEFPEVFENGGFDVVLGNPPRLRFVSLSTSATAWSPRVGKSQGISTA